MKELSIEEKAKAYDEALKKAKDMLSYKEVRREDMEYLFPELKESKDERIRKELICYFEKYPSIVIGPFNTKECIAWLEKQSTPQVRTDLEWVNTIDDACDKRYLEEYAHGEYCHEQSFKWGFQEGVDWLEKQDEHKPAIEMKSAEESLGIDSDTYNKIVDECIYGERKPAWSEEDEKMLKDTIRFCELCGNQVSVNWLKSLIPQNRWKPSDEQIKVCKEVYADILSARGFYQSTVNSELNRLEEELKKLREE